MKKNWLLGAGPMAVDYAKVLNAMQQDYVAVGRSEASAAAFFEAVGRRPQTGGVDAFLASGPEVPDWAIIAVSIENLADTCMKVIDYGVKKILLEKPGVGYASEIDAVVDHAQAKQAKVVLAYNRRFYASVRKARQVILEDGGGVKSFHFEFTEWSHQIRNLKKHKAELENWFLGNSTHVIDTAFFLGGKPREISCYHKGGNDWHPRATIYAGAGITDKDALFAYDANWEAPGRWNLDIMTSRHRLIFKPMEKLQIMKIGSVAVEFVSDIDYSLDEQYKPGLFLQTQAFLNGDYADFCDIQEQKRMMEIYRKMSGY